MNKYAVVRSIGPYERDDEWWVEFYDADDGDHAEEQALDADPRADIVCVATVPA
jgi:hypothetical protein